jgi:hypothetical protein
VLLLEENEEEEEAAEEAAEEEEEEEEEEEDKDFMPVLDCTTQAMLKQHRLDSEKRTKNVPAWHPRNTSFASSKLIKP